MMEFRCKECKCTDVQYLSWIRINSNKPAQHYSTFSCDTTYCPNCDEDDINLEEFNGSNSTNYDKLDSFDD